MATIGFSGAVAALAMVLPVAGAIAQGTQAPPAAAAGISLGLHKLEPVDGACRAYLVVQNQTDRTLESLRLDLVLFGGDGVIAKRLSVETGPVTAGKMTVRPFDVRDLQCDAIGRVLLNDVLACESKDGPVEGCLGMLETASRADAPFLK